jgi:DNA (cytosine-5)-methyltransferase 1
MLRVLDTFAGAGGFSLGFAMAGCEAIGAIESDAWAASTFAFNHPEAVVLTRDIKAVSDSELRSAFANAPPDILLGGPPCQGFSICRKNPGDPTDPRNSLFVEFLRVAKVLEPGLVVMENVPNIERSRNKTGEMVIQIIARELTALGYHTSYIVLEATDFGVPQIRRRLFIVGSTSPLRQPFPLPTHTTRAGSGDFFAPKLQPCPSLWDAISDLPPLAAGQGSETQDYCLPPLNQYQAALREGSTAIFNHTAMKHTKRMVERFTSMSCGQSASDVPKHLGPLRRSGGGQVSGRAYDQNNRRMHPDRPCHTVPASFYANFVHPYQHRNFTPREGARIQSFPDWYVFKGKPTVVSHKLLAREGRTEETHLCQYSQIGNAVPPLLAHALAKHLLTQLKPHQQYASSR